MDGPAFITRNFAPSVNRIAQHVKDAAQSPLADGNTHGSTRVKHVHPAHHTVGGTQSDAADTPSTEVLLDFSGHLDFETLDVGLNLHRIVNCRKMGVGKFCVKRRSDDLCDMANVITGRHICSLYSRMVSVATL